MKRIHARAIAAILAMAGLGQQALAADGTYISEAAFTSAASGAAIESFETLAGRSRGVAPIVAPLLTISTAGAPIGVQTAANAPDLGYDSAATDGTHYVSVYLPNVAQGSITFTLSGPSLAFGMNIMDVGEVNGTISLRTNAGAYAAGVVLLSYPPIVVSGGVNFIGLTQNTAFTQVTLTVTGLDEAYGLDKVYVQAAPVPEPASALSLLLGLAGLGALAARRQSRQSAPFADEPSHRQAS